MRIRCPPALTTLSIKVMEIVDNLVVPVIAVAMDAGLTSHHGGHEGH